MSQVGGKHLLAKSKNIPAYFSQGEKKDARSQRAWEPPKIAKEGKTTGGETDMPTKEDLQALVGRLDNPETGLLHKITELIQPISNKLEQFTLSLQTIAGVAEVAMELGITHKDDLKALQDSDMRHSEQLVILGNKQRFFNLKFRGLDELVGKDSDLTIYMSTWLASALDLEGDCAPLLTQSYGVGRIHDQTKHFPRDVIVTCGVM